MTREEMITEAVVRAAYYQVVLVDRDCDHDFSDTWTDALSMQRLAAFPGGALVGTMSDGEVAMRLVLDEAPPDNLCSRYDHVVRGSIDLRSGEIEVFGTLDEEPAAGLAVPPGPYTMTVAFSDFGEPNDRCEVRLQPMTGAPPPGGVMCSLGLPRSARDAEYRRQLRARLGRDLVRDVPYENPGLEEALPAFATLELRAHEPTTGQLYASTGGWEASGATTCEFLTSLRASEDVLAELLAALSHYQADPDIDVYDGRLIALGRPIVPGSALDHLLLTARRPETGERLEPLHPLGRHVDLLWTIPLAAAEAAGLREHGPEAALARLSLADLDDPARAPV